MGQQRRAQEADRNESEIRSEAHRGGPGKLDGRVRRCWLFVLLIKKNLFHGLAKGAGDLESERKTRVVFACFDGIDGAARDSDLGGKLRLRPFFFRSQYAQAGLHRYRHEYRINPMLHRMIISGGMPSQETAWKPNLWRKPIAAEKAKVPTKA